MMRSVNKISLTQIPNQEREGLINSGIPFGFGLLAIFQGSYQYLMDAYGPYAASAVSPHFHFHFHLHLHLTSPLFSPHVRFKVKYRDLSS